MIFPSTRRKCIMNLKRRWTVFLSLWLIGVSSTSAWAHGLELLIAASMGDALGVQKELLILKLLPSKFMQNALTFKGSEGHTPLHRAARQGYDQIVNYLLDA